MSRIRRTLFAVMLIFLGSCIVPSASLALDRPVLQEADLKAGQSTPRGDPVSVADQTSTTIIKSKAFGNDSNFAKSTGPKKLLLVRLGFSDQRDPIAKAAWTASGTGPSYAGAVTQESGLKFLNEQVVPLIRELSYGKTTILPEVSSSVYVLPQTATYYATIGGNTAIQNDSKPLYQGDYNPDNYDFIILFHNDLATIPGSTATYAGLSGGKYITANGGFGVITHEILHSYGLGGHSNFWNTSDGDPFGRSGTSTLQGDPFDILGSATGYTGAHTNPIFKLQLGWISESMAPKITTSGTYRIQAFDHEAVSSDSIVALRIARDETSEYWVCFHPNMVPENKTISEGAYVLWKDSRQYDAQLVGLSMPFGLYADGRRPDQSAALGLKVGDTVTEGIAGFSLQSVAVGGTAPNKYLDVKVSFSPVVPTIAKQPDGVSINEGQGTSFSVTAWGVPTPTYRWQRWTAAGATWADLAESEFFSGCSSKLLTLKSTTASMNGDQYRCVVSNTAGSTPSSAAALKILSGGVVTLAGQAGQKGGNDGLGRLASFFSASGLCLDSAGSLIVADGSNGLRKVTQAGQVSTISTRSGMLASMWPYYAKYDAFGNLYQVMTYAHLIKKLSPSGGETVVAGVDVKYGSNDGPAVSATFNTPRALAFDDAGNIYVADTNNLTVRKIAATGVVSTLAGKATVYGHDDGVGSAASFSTTYDIVMHPTGYLLVADKYNHAIRKVTLDGVVSTYVGAWDRYGSKDGLLSEAELGAPNGLAVDADGNVYVTDVAQGTIRLIVPEGRVFTLAGKVGDLRSVDGAIADARFVAPGAITVDSEKNLYVVDGDCAVRKISAPNIPIVLMQPTGSSVDQGGNIKVSVIAFGRGTLSYQWKRGSVVVGTNSSTLTIPSALSSDAGDYSVTISTAQGSAISEAATVDVKGDHQLYGLSTRAYVGSDDNILIAGFIIRGAGTKKILLRSRIPIYNDKPMDGAIVDPMLELTTIQGALLASNDNWSTDTNKLEIDSASRALSSPLVSGSKDAAVIVNLGAGIYTAMAKGVAGNKGVAILEIYDLDKGSAAELQAISSRGRIVNGEPMIAGYITKGNPRKFLIQAVGPSVPGVSDFLANPKLRVVTIGSGQEITNDDWASDLTNRDKILASHSLGGSALATQSKDAALVAVQGEGIYTAVVESVTAGASGVAMVEIYDVTE